MSRQSGKKISPQLTLFAVDSHARTCPLPESGRVWMESEADSGLSSIELFGSFRLNGCLLRTSPACYPLMPEGILPSSFQGWQNSGIARLGESWTLNISEFPKDAAVCSLSEVLETQVAPKYYLSPRAAAGILRRAEKRGKELPPQLANALRVLAESE